METYYTCLSGVSFKGCARVVGEARSAASCGAPANPMPTTLPVAVAAAVARLPQFGSYVTHETKHFIYFYLGQVAILLFKSG